MPFLPNSKVQTSPVGVGCAYLAEGLRLADDARVIDIAFEAGARHFDVAPQYGLGTAEKVLGYALREKRAYVTIVSKVGIPRGRASKAQLVSRALAAPLRRYLRRKGPTATATSGASARNFDVDYVERSLGESLGFLRTDYLDAWLLHMVSLDDLTDELLAFLIGRRTAGVVGAFGLATTRQETARILAAFPGIFDVVQYSWSVLDDPLESDGGNPFLITHRSLMRAYRPLLDWFAADVKARDRLSASAGVDLADPRQLSSALVGAAVAVNPNGIALVASRSPARTRDNVTAAQDELVLAAGRRLADALLLEPERPRPPQ